jgi:hypothetical protein
MKNTQFIKTFYTVLITLSLLITYSCSSDSAITEEVNNSPEQVDNSPEVKDASSLLFMYEEEKLARDTYTYLGGLWSVNQFENIKKSEQKHMDAVASLLDKNGIEYTVLPYGEFHNNDLQALYNQFKIDGAVSKSNALQIGATIEDLDIVDLQNFINKTSHTSIISVYESLLCGSRNHLRNFLKAIENIGDTYSPQYLSLDDYANIINGSQERCN